MAGKHAPIKENHVKRAKKSAWLTEEITTAQTNRDYYHKKQDWEILSPGAIKQKASFVVPKKFSLKMLSMKIDNTFLWKHVKDITGQSQANKLPSALQSDQSKKISNDQELIQSDPISCPQNQKGNN